MYNYKGGVKMKEVKFSDKVYKTDFKVKSLGYGCEEVDQFLDEINFNIVKLEREIQRLIEQNSDLERSKAMLEAKNKDLVKEICSLKAQNFIPSTSNANYSNMEILNRITSIEEMIQRLLDKKD